ncbi:hypothetical protein [Streptomyces halobius]|uniref:Uncharacterized protein n=1 Tax=Streptomyces halobius TaxID=2879846 RepID=A0ABY4M339_9ACTN|nr:hypothetical protein [Streptomyces halobius]UQA92195.1 hypothetical protein K9S39_10425 [Streptomyces halobius]
MGLKDGAEALLIDVENSAYDGATARDSSVLIAGNGPAGIRGLGATLVFSHGVILLIAVAVRYP